MEDTYVKRTRIDSPEDDDVETTRSKPTKSDSMSGDKPDNVRQENTSTPDTSSGGQGMVNEIEKPDPEEILEVDYGSTKVRAKRKHIEAFSKRNPRNRNVHISENWRYRDDEYERFGHF